MGHRTLSLHLVLQALFLDGDAYDQLRDDDNPFIEGLFLIVIIGAGTALLSLIGQTLAWASIPQMDVIKEAILHGFEKMSWWSAMASNPQAYDSFLRIWNTAWQIFPALFGAPDPGRAAMNILVWPVTGLLSWLVYGLLAHVFAKLFKGDGTLGQTLGTTALAYTPWLFHGLGFIPFFTIGGAISTWQLICRYKALRSVHRFAWGRAFWTTVLPFAVYFLFWLLVGGIAAVIIAAIVGRGL